MVDGGGAGLRPDVSFDAAAVLEAIAACRTAAQVCGAVGDARVRAGARARVGWEGRMRDAFDLADDALLAELEAGEGELERIFAELEALAERAAALRRSVDRHNERVLEQRAAVGS